MTKTLAGIVKSIVAAGAITASALGAKYMHEEARKPVLTGVIEECVGGSKDYDWMTKFRLKHFGHRDMAYWAGYSNGFEGKVQFWDSERFLLARR